MGPTATTASGVLVGLILFLAMALTGVIAVNGANNPGVTLSQQSAAAGSTAEAPKDLPRGGSLGALDLNGDGKLSLAEAAGHADIVIRFERADRNRDGKLTQAEFDRLAKLPEKSPPAKKSQRRRPEATPPAGG